MAMRTIVDAASRITKCSISFRSPPRARIAIKRLSDEAMVALLCLPWLLRGDCAASPFLGGLGRGRSAPERLRFEAFFAIPVVPLAADEPRTRAP
jgi:hypothetical protein